MKRRLAIMRPSRDLPESVAIAESLGFEVTAVPFVDVQAADNSSFDEFVDRVREGRCNMVIFTSANGVRFTMSRLADKEGFLDALRRTKVMVIGPTTRDALAKLGVDAGMPATFSSEGLVAHLGNMQGRVIEIARSDHGAPVLIEGLRDSGATVHETVVYTIAGEHSEAQREMIRKAERGEIDAFAFTSSMMVKSFMAAAADMGVNIVDVLNSKVVGAIGKPTAETLQSYGVRVAVIPDKFLFRDLLSGIQKEMV